MRYICSFVPSKETGHDDAPLRCRVRWDGSHSIVSMNVGYRVNPDRWVPEVGRCASGSFHSRRRIPAAIINREIERFEQAVAAVFAGFEGSADSPSVQTVKTALRAALGFEEAQSVTVRQALDEFCIRGSSQLNWSEATVKKFRALRGHLGHWRPGIGWGDFDAEGLTSFVGFLRDDAGLRNSSTLKYVTILQGFLRWADGRRYLACQDYEAFKPKFRSIQRRVIFLTWDELMKLWDYEPDDSCRHLEKVRDIFCFCAFTSLRYSDAMNLRWPDVTATSIRVTTVKTADALEIELNRWSSEILERYVDEAYGGYVFPRLSNQKMNQYLKVLCRICGIDDPVRITWYKGCERFDEVHPKWELVGSHCARRTFVCNALMMGISPTTVMSWTGHSDFKAMKPYIAVADDAKVKAMQRFDLLQNAQK